MPATHLLDDALLDRIRSRAAGYDRDNAFFTEDLDDLTDAGYLRAMVPVEMGGLGVGLDDIAHAQRRLAGAAPATALAVGMHQVWMGVAQVVRRSGDDAMDFVLREAADGEVFGFGISEPGNDLVLFGSGSDARPDGQGGYTFHGTKIFTSLSPAWTRLGTFGTDAGGDEPMSVYGFVTRDGGGVQIKDDWDTVGMRASQSCTTILDGAHAPADRIVRRIPPGPSADPLIFGIFACFEILISNAYAGIAQRALDLAVEAVQRRTSRKRDGASYATDPDTRWRIADMAIALDGLWPALDQAARDVDAGVDRGPMWMPQLSALKLRTTQVAQRVVQQAVQVAGGSAYFNRSELSRLYRDVLAGGFHPSSDDSTHGAWASALLGDLLD